MHYGGAKKNNSANNKVVCLSAPSGKYVRAMSACHASLSLTHPPLLVVSVIKEGLAVRGFVHDHSSSQWLQWQRRRAGKVELAFYISHDTVLLSFNNRPWEEEGEVLKSLAIGCC